jgi:hypothetical protein
MDKSLSRVKDEQKISTEQKKVTFQKIGNKNPFQ